MRGRCPLHPHNPLKRLDLNFTFPIFQERPPRAFLFFSSQPLSPLA